MADREGRRWMVALLGPVLAATASVFATFATAGGADWTNWLFAPALLLGPTWVVTIV